MIEFVNKDGTRLVFNRLPIGSVFTIEESVVKVALLKIGRDKAWGLSHMVEVLVLPLTKVVEYSATLTLRERKGEEEDEDEEFETLY